MLNRFKWWLLKKLLTGFLCDRPGHIQRLDLLMFKVRTILRKEFNEDNLAGTYWHIRVSLDDAFEDYHWVQEIQKRENYPYTK